jgi:hypothetical protein
MPPAETVTEEFASESILIPILIPSPWEASYILPIIPPHKKTHPNPREEKPHTQGAKKQGQRESRKQNRKPEITDLIVDL